ncbi:voltage-gated chloride channel protein [Aerococcus agrisoli]|uniref:Voltage-gated chloride channel protein n=2 Tax=Aerococcus agrisoli TaxID=2487350 RepID=A0A3N4GCP6_9LACT|nr:voltage-gated chloride channel protein [Aerococcus agrisoli]
MKHMAQVAYLIAMSIFIGIAVGAFETLFGKVIVELSAFRLTHFYYLVPFLPVAGMIFVYFLYKYGKTSNKGIALLFLVDQGKEDKIPLRLVPFALLGTWMTHLFGGSAGREGVAVQIGGTIANWFDRTFKLAQNAGDIIVIGVAAGFAGLFGTPIAATFFAMEMLEKGKLRYQVMVPTFIAAFVSSSTSEYLGLKTFKMPLHLHVELDYILLLKLCVIGIIFGFVGASFGRILVKSKHYFAEKIPNPVIRIGLGGIAVALCIILLHEGRYAGTGSNLILASFGSEKVYIYDWLLKMSLTILTVGVGFWGGEVTPLFSIGASLGAVIAHVVGLPIPFAAALGYTSVFGSATNTLIAPIFIGGEIFGFEYTPYFVITSAVAYVFSRHHSIYPLQIIDNRNL